MAIALASALDAKNETVTRQGYSPNMLVFGTCINYPELLGEDDYDQATMAQAMDAECEMAQRSKIRNHARQVLLRDGVQQKLKRALQRRPATQDQVFVLGQVIYFYTPDTKPRYRQDRGRWRGPAVVILQESHQKCYVSWRGRCLLLASPNMRPASQEESMAHEWIKNEMDKVSQTMGEESGKEFQDLSRPPPPEVGESSQQHQLPLPDVRHKKNRSVHPAKSMMRGMRSVKKLLSLPGLQNQRQQLGIEDRRKRPRKQLKAIEDGSVRSHKMDVEIKEGDD